MFSMMVDSGGGAGWYESSAFSERNELCGTGREMTEPKKEILAIHFDERRGSSVSAAADQYLRVHCQTRTEYELRESTGAHPATSSGHAPKIFMASS